MLSANYCAQPRFREPNECGAGGYPQQQGQLLFRADQMPQYPSMPPEFYLDNRHFFPQPPPADYLAAYHRQPSFPFHFPPKADSQPAHCQWINEDGKICGQGFYSMKDFAEHLTAMHIGVIDTATHTCRWKDCSRIGKPFKAKYKLVNHVRVHTGERPFTCDMCKKVFARSENMKIHKRTHTNEKPFSCTHPGCQKRFANSSDRKKHMHVHTDDKPYTCKYKGCGKTYTHPSSLRKHLKAHEKNSCSPDLDESSDSGHASSSTPGDDFVTCKIENEMPMPPFALNPHLLSPPYNQPPFHAHPAMFHSPDVYNAYR